MAEPAETNKPSKKDLQKAAKKEKKAAAKSGEEKENNTTLVISFSKPSSPELTRALELASGSSSLVKYSIDKSADVHLPILTNTATNNGSISGDANIVRYLLRTVPETAELSASSDAWLASQVDQWLDVYTFGTNTTGFALDTLVALLEKHLADKTYVVGDSFTVADLAMLLLLSRLKFASSESNPHVSRWHALASPRLPASLVIPISFVPPAAGTAAAAAPSGKKAAAAATTEAAAAAPANAAVEDGGTCPPLLDAVEGQVCTRFPPEPSGYLHIGHAKAVLLNQYYAQRYKGRLLVRFDDTNPSKEKEEFEENIIEDLKTLGVVGDAVSHSSDHFEMLADVARRMIKEGNAYMDDTDQETMQAERLERKESKHRNQDPATALALFEKLVLGEAEAQSYCLRAKIDMSSVNGTMRDPVLFRYNATPHHRTGTRFKAYPTYDFACPVIDSYEGVTHALRTTEYNDRDEQYYFLQDILGLRRTHIQAFGKMNFVHTVLSKRKLTWFVDNGLVEGWFDPRFPTIQGCVRRGMNVEALKNFIIAQGASRRIITMEWDKFWAENKKVLEERSPRYMGVSVEDKVKVTITNVAAQVTEHEVQIIPNKPEAGVRIMRRFNEILLDQIDAATYKVGEEVTLLRWGNITITDIQKEGDKVVSMTATHDPDATNFSKTKKTTWIAALPTLIPCQIFEFDHLISKPKLGDEDKFQDFLTPNTKMESAALGDPCLADVKAGDVIQLERKGFYRCDVAYGGSADKPIVLFAIPDGKVKPTSIAAIAAAKEKEAAAAAAAAKKAAKK